MQHMRDRGLGLACCPRDPQERTHRYDVIWENGLKQATYYNVETAFTESQKLVDNGHTVQVIKIY